jgi:hypothetical protein
MVRNASKCGLWMDIQINSVGPYASIAPQGTSCEMIKRPCWEDESVDAFKRAVMVQSTFFIVALKVRNVRARKLTTNCYARTDKHIIGSVQRQTINNVNVFLVWTQLVYQFSTRKSTISGNGLNK